MCHSGHQYSPRGLVEYLDSIHKRDTSSLPVYDPLGFVIYHAYQNSLFHQHEERLSNNAARHEHSCVPGKPETLDQRAQRAQELFRSHRSRDVP